LRSGGGGFAAYAAVTKDLAEIAWWLAVRPPQRQLDHARVKDLETIKKSCNLVASAER
jgi:hypothetical protein